MKFAVNMSLDFLDATLIELKENGIHTEPWAGVSYAIMPEETELPAKRPESRKPRRLLDRL